MIKEGFSFEGRHEKKMWPDVDGDCGWKLSLVLAPSSTQLGPNTGGASCFFLQAAWSILQ